MSRRFALLVLVAAFIVGACGGDDSDKTGTDDDTSGATDQAADDDSGESGTHDSAGGAETTQPEASGGEGYTPGMRSNFMNACVAQPGATESQCECTLDEITQAVPVEDFVAYDQALQQDPATPPPTWLEAAVTTCS